MATYNERNQATVSNQIVKENHNISACEQNTSGVSKACFTLNVLMLSFIRAFYILLLAALAGMVHGKCFNFIRSSKFNNVYSLWFWERKVRSIINIVSNTIGKANIINCHNKEYIISMTKSIWCFDKCECVHSFKFNWHECHQRSVTITKAQVIY